MSHKAGYSIATAILALAIALSAAARAGAVNIEPSFEDQKSSIDKQDRLHLEASASLNAPVAQVYDALSNPDKAAKYNPQITAIKVISQSATGKVVEYKGQTLPIPNAPPSLQVKYTFDPGKNAVTAESVGKAVIQFHAEYTLTPSKDGKSTEIHYTSVSTNPGKLLGMDAPEFLRRQGAVDAMMRNLRTVGQYIQNGGK